MERDDSLRATRPPMPPVAPVMAMGMGFIVGLWVSSGELGVEV